MEKKRHHKKTEKPTNVKSSLDRWTWLICSRHVRSNQVSLNFELTLLHIIIAFPQKLIKRFSFVLMCDINHTRIVLCLFNYPVYIGCSAAAFFSVYIFCLVSLFLGSYINNIGIFVACLSARSLPYL